MCHENTCGEEKTEREGVEKGKVICFKVNATALESI